MNHTETGQFPMNFFLSITSPVVGFFASFFTTENIPVISAIVLPCLFFAIGKTVDVLVRIYFERKQK
jgi:hypothetical protein